MATPVSKLVKGIPAPKGTLGNIGAKPNQVPNQAPKPGQAAVPGAPKPTNRPSLNTNGAITPQSVGLNVGDKTAYDPLAAPKTQGAFNQQVFDAASSSWEPQLQQLQGDTNQEDQVSKQRNTGIGNIYTGYQNAATSAFNTAREYLSGLLAQNASGNQQSQATLAAALSAAANGGKQLSGMLGGTPSPEAGIQPYEAAGTASGAANQNELSQLVTGVMGQELSGLTNPAVGRAQASDAESLRHTNALTSIQGDRDTVVQGIPAALEKARQDLVTTLQSGTNLSLQNTLAKQQFNLTADKQASDAKAAAAALAEQKKVDQANINHQSTADEQNQQTINISAKDLAEKTKVDQQTIAAQLSTTTGKAEANALAALQAWVTPSKNELITTKDPTTGATTTKVAPGWHRDAGTMLQTLIDTYGLTQARALQLMASLTSPLGGANGNMTIGQWAKTFTMRNKIDKTPAGPSKAKPKTGLKVGANPLTSKPKVSLPKGNPLVR